MLFGEIFEYSVFSKWYSSHLHMRIYLSSSTSHHQLVAVFAKTNLLDAKPGIVAVRVKTANLHNDNTHTSTCLCNLKVTGWKQNAIQVLWCVLLISGELKEGQAAEALLLPLFSATYRDSPPFLRSAKTCALSCLSHTTKNSNRNPSTHGTGASAKQRGEVGHWYTHTHTHIWESTERVGRWVWFSLQGGKKGKAPHPTSSHMRATFLNMQLRYHRRREGSWEGVKEGGGMRRI